MIWLLTGDEYDLTSHKEDTPCRFRDGTMTTLDKAKESDKPFDIWIGYWEDAIVTSNNYVKGDIKITLLKDKKSPSRRELEALQEAVYRHLNDKEFLENNGLLHITVILNNG